MDVRFDDVGTFDDDGGDDSVLDFFLSRSISECSDVLARFNSERSDVPGGVGSCFKIGIQEREREWRRLDVRFDDVGTFDDDVGDDSVLDFFLSRFNFKRFDDECK